MLIDAAITLGVFVVLMVVASLAENVPRTGGLFLALVFGWALLYEPLQVWRFGGTIGHRRANIRVVSDRTGGAPSFPASFGRFLVKAVLGLPSFISMAFTRRHQSIHDLLTGTTVQLRDLSIASGDDYLLERAPERVTIAIPATPLRRILVTVLYIVGAYFLSGVLSLFLVSEPCLSRSECSSIDNSNSRLVGFLLLASVVTIAIQGWRGRLFGARSQIAVAPISASKKEVELPVE
jgi:uncharacterized RDD family membrane protein YckC